MVKFLKAMLSAFMIAGLAIAVYGGWEILSTVNFVKVSPERVWGIFTGYDEVEVVSRSSTTNLSGDLDFQTTRSYMSYPEFEFVGKDGKRQHVRESKHHVIAYFKPGQKVEILVSPYGSHRLAGFYSLYVLDLCILVFGLLFILIPFTIYRVVIPSLNTQAGVELAKFASEQYQTISSAKIGPITVGKLMKGSVIFMAGMLILAVSVGLAPYLKQLRLGFGYALIEALEEERYDEARDLILRKEGINRTDEYDQTPLILALAKDRTDLARLLVEAGADVNVKSETIDRTALLIAVRSGDVQMVKLLLAKGAKPDADEDRDPPVFIAIAKGHDEIARTLIESGCDLKKRYASGEKEYTVGDLAVLAQKKDLISLIRQRGGAFTMVP